MGYELSKDADNDIVEIYVQGYENFGRIHAESYADGLWKLLDLIGERPTLARERKETKPPVRIHPYKSHVVIYTIQNETVNIQRIRHGRENWYQELTNLP
ncbi:MAG: type II toxin-antitoxin system RelE/ParE family toxin [Pseudomonadota bacterium]